MENEDREKDAKTESSRRNDLHIKRNPQTSNAGLEKALHKKDIPNIETPKPNYSVPNSDAQTSLEGDVDYDGEGELPVEEEVKPDAPVHGVWFGNIVPNKTIFYIIIFSLCAFLLLFLIIITFLIKNSDSLNYASGSYFDSEEYQKIYSEVEAVATDFNRKYHVSIDKYLIISTLIAYRDNDEYNDTTEDSTYDDVDVEDDSENGSHRSITELRNYAEILAKYQIKTVTSCNFDSSSMRKIASNDDSNNLLNFWTSATAKEKNYDCSGNSNDIKYELSVEEGKIDDDNSGSTLFWNLIDEDFLKEYYSTYFDDVSDEAYEKLAEDTVQYIYLYAEDLKNLDENGSSNSSCNGSAFWWPIGSAETTTSGGKTFAKGEPVATVITATFGGDDSVHNGSHGAMDIAAGGDVNIIASKAGTVIYPTSLSQTRFPPGHLGSTDGGGLGNYVIIEHSDGTYTLYGHMRANTITVLAGNEVSQGQVIGKMGTSGDSSGQHVHFEIRVGSNTRSNRVDPAEYVDMNDPRPGCGEFSLTETALSKQEFVTLMHNYCTTSGNVDFCNNFSSHAETVYESSKRYNVNPELVVVTAQTESGFRKCGSYYNFWGIGIPNGQGCEAGPHITNLADGVREYAQTISRYLDGGNLANSITERYNSREAAGCDSAGHGLPGTLAGMQSVYSWIGNYRYNPGDSGLGGCYYLNRIYGDSYCASHSTCSDRDGNTCPLSSRTTVCEQNDYTAWQIQGKVEARRNIFGI